MPLNCKVKGIQSIYKTLKKDGVTDALLAPKGQRPTCENVVDHVFDNYQSYPGIIKDISGYEPTWVITDKAAIQKGREAKAFISSILEGAGLREGSVEYKRALAIGLFYFTYAPTKQDLAGGWKEAPLWKNMDAELRLEGLGRFSKWLEENGGLGLGNMQSDAPFEASADDTLNYDMGYCTERSKVVYAVFKDAGLDPFFAMISAKDVDAAWNDHWHGKIPRDEALAMLQNMGHIVVGIDIGGESRYFDAMIKNAISSSNAPFSGVARRIGLREFRIIENSNRIGNFTAKNNVASQMKAGTIPANSDFIKFTEGLKAEVDGLYERTLLLGSTPTLLECRLHAQRLEMLKSLDGGLDEMSGVYEAGKDTCSDMPLFLVHAANAMINHYEVEALVKGLIDKALGLEPDNVVAHGLMATYWIRHADHAEVGKWMEKAYALDKTLVPVLNDIGFSYIKRKEYAKAEEWLKKALEADPLDPMTTKNLAFALVNQEKFDEAVKLFLKNIAMLDDSADNYHSLTALYSNQKLDEQSSLLKEMAYLYKHKGDEKISLLFHYGDFLEKQKRPDLAIDMYESFVAAEPNKDACFKLIGLYHAAGRFKDEALKYRQLNDLLGKERFFNVGLGWLVALWNAKEPLDPAINNLNEMANARLNPDLDLPKLVGLFNGYYSGLPDELAAREDVKRPISQIYILIAETAREKGAFDIVDDACERALLTGPVADAITNTMKCQSLRLPDNPLDGTPQNW